MPIVKKSTVKKAAPAANPAPVKKTASAPVAKKAPAATPEKTVKKAAVAAPAKETKKTAAAVKPVGGKKTLTGNTKNFDIKEGSQATQEQFIDKYYKKLQALDYDITKEQCKSLKKAYSETLSEVTSIASYQDVDAGIFYARRYIKSRVTEPPKARDGLKTLMTGHYELKVRKLLGDESEFKFFGNLNDDGTVFVTTDGDEIPLGDDDVKPVKKSAKKSVVGKKPKKVVEEVEEEEEIVEDEEEVTDETEEEVEEVSEEDEGSEEEDLSDFLDDAEEE